MHTGSIAQFFFFQSWNCCSIPCKPIFVSDLVILQWGFLRWHKTHYKITYRQPGVQMSILICFPQLPIRFITAWKCLDMNGSTGNTEKGKTIQNRLPEVQTHWPPNKSVGWSMKIFLQYITESFHTVNGFSYFRTVTVCTL